MPLEKIDRTPLLAFALLALAGLACATLTADLSASEPTAPPPAESASAGDTAAETPSGQDAGTRAGSLAIPTGQCANNLLPLERGNRWTYRTHTGGSGEAGEAGTPTPTPSQSLTYSWTVTEVTETEATIRMEAEDLPITSTYTVECEQGAILSFPTIDLLMGIPGGAVGAADLSYEHSEGLYLPSVETLEGENWDYEWNSEMAISGTITSSFGDRSTEMVFADSPWLMDWETGAEGHETFEPVSVPAGEFEEALVLTQEADITMNMALPESSQNVVVQFTSLTHQWYVPELGLVRTETLDSNMGMEGMDLPTDFDDTGATQMLLEYERVEP